jgi:hypothetical protein
VFKFCAIILCGTVGVSCGEASIFNLLFGFPLLTINKAYHPEYDVQQ